ncbi:MAG: alpha/beta hydrolase [Gammaproteobacteria bacterium]|nr:alpha/beta hydrolase [Gammaproteobacteria bacterium]
MNRGHSGSGTKASIASALELELSATGLGEGMRAAGRSCRRTCRYRRHDDTDYPDNVLIDDHRIANGVHGKGIPLVLIHGTPSFSFVWRNVLPQLTEVGRRVHVFDLLGYGHSERPVDPAVDTSVAGQVMLLRKLFDHWNLESAHVIAHDIGGAVAQRFTLDYPRQVRTLTLIDTVSFDSWPSPRTREQIEAGLDKLIKAPDTQHRAHFRDWIRTAFADPNNMAEEVLAAYVNVIAGPVGQSSFFQHQVAHYDPRYTQDLTDRLVELGEHPVQLIWGADDRWQVIDWAYRLHASIPGARLHVLGKCGHFAMEDRPEEIARLVSGFTDELT